MIKVKIENKTGNAFDTKVTDLETGKEITNINKINVSHYPQEPPEADIRFIFTEFSFDLKAPIVRFKEPVLYLEEDLILNMAESIQKRRNTL